DFNSKEISNFVTPYMEILPEELYTNSDYNPTERPEPMETKEVKDTHCDHGPTKGPTSMKNEKINNGNDPRSKKNKNPRSKKNKKVNNDNDLKPTKESKGKKISNIDSK